MPRLGRFDARCLPVGARHKSGRLAVKLRNDESPIIRRGLIGEGETAGNGVQKVTFDPAPTPVMSATIIYYKPL